MTEPEIALVFTPEPWVEDLHRHLSDHGGARVRSLVVEPAAALDEHYDVLVVGHRWVALTSALVADVQARGRAVLGVYDREEPAGRRHLGDLGVDAVVESDAAPDTFVAVLSSCVGVRDDATGPATRRRDCPIVVVGGPAGVGRTEVAIQLAASTARRSRRRVALVDADDVAPSIAPRLGLPVDPNLATAIDAVEHGRGELSRCVHRDAATGAVVVGGLASAAGWAQVRAGEVVRATERLAEDADLVLVDIGGSLEEIGGAPRGRHAVARALLVEADAVVAVCDASPVGVIRLTSWLAEAHRLATGASFAIVVNRAPSSRFVRGELFAELGASVPGADITFVPFDARVATAAWNGEAVARGPFTRALEPVAAFAAAVVRRSELAEAFEEAS